MNLNDSNWKQNITITLPAYQWLAIHGNVCLGLRHPRNIGSARNPAISFLSDLELILLEKSLLTPVDISFIHKTGN